ncbi:hypothetical protein C2G38_951256 [Gigaspora rosea]|uniref:Uncharacterized protein n=1 Tax=Gigaspora rosea TaxID=44941 RepID=A0A397VN53_9GLOM|nr:hypothetical protein C2G38_951256 [Gigaspora rosea]
MVLALPLAAVEPNTTTGPCTATCSRGANYPWSLHCHLQPWSQVHNRSLPCYYTNLYTTIPLPKSSVECTHPLRSLHTCDLFVMCFTYIPIRTYTFVCLVYTFTQTCTFGFVQYPIRRLYHYLRAVRSVHTNSDLYAHDLSVMCSLIPLYEHARSLLPSQCFELSIHIPLPSKLT